MASLQCSEWYIWRTSSFETTCAGTILGPFQRPELGACSNIVAMLETVHFMYYLFQNHVHGHDIDPILLPAIASIRKKKQVGHRASIR